MLYHSIPDYVPRPQAQTAQKPKTEPIIAPKEENSMGMPKPPATDTNDLFGDNNNTNTSNIADPWAAFPSGNAEPA